jgi:hypothetical protein
MRTAVLLIALVVSGCNRPAADVAEAPPADTAIFYRMTPAERAKAEADLRDMKARSTAKIADICRQLILPEYYADELEPCETMVGGLVSQGYLIGKMETLLDTTTSR